MKETSPGDFMSSTTKASLSTRRIISRFKMAQEGSLWENASQDLHRFNDLYKAVQRKPGEPKAEKACLIGINKMLDFQIWAKKCLDPEEYQELLTTLRAISKGIKSKEFEPSLINTFKEIVQTILTSLAPGSFKFSGFNINNYLHLPEDKCLKTLEGLEFLQGLFKRRGVEKLLDKSFSKVVLSIDLDATASFNWGTKELTLSVDKLSNGKEGRFIKWVNETFLHEFGHYIHHHYLAPEAKKVWDQPWDDLGLSSLADPNAPEDSKRVQKLAPLEIVTDYGKVDKFEDFAETFLVFMVAPEKLTPTAKFRMQRCLSLSGLYGKPVLRLGTHETLVRLYHSK